MKQPKEKNHAFRYLWNVISGLDEVFPMVEEYKFAESIGRKWQFDFANVEKKIAVEVEGNAWHVRGGGKHMQDRDLEKYNHAALLGWRVLRFSPSMMRNDPEGCIEIVKDCLKASRLNGRGS